MKFLINIIAWCIPVYCKWFGHNPEAGMWIERHNTRTRYYTCTRCNTVVNIDLRNCGGSTDGVLLK